MALYTSNYLKNLSKNKTATESVRLMSESNTTHTYFDIFLCHSYLDKDDVEGLYLELTKMGFKVYVDWIVDPHLSRDNVTKENAEHIRKRLRSSRSLLLATSVNASISKWVPWELGYVDGHTQQCALLPVSTDNITRSIFIRTEYLKLYPYVEKPNDLNQFTSGLWAVEDANHYVELKSWLRGQKPLRETRNFY